MKIPLPQRRSRTDIDMVPMINFAFLLLIFFLLVGRFGPQDVFKVTPPRTAMTSVEPAAGDPVLLFAADGALAFGGSRVEAAALPAALRAWRASHPQQALSLKADADADASRLVDLLELLRSAGVSEVRLLTRPPLP